MSANRKKAKRSSSPDTLSTQGSVRLSPSGLPPELLLEGPTTEVVTETPILQVPVKKELVLLRIHCIQIKSYHTLYLHLILYISCYVRAFIISLIHDFAYFQHI